LHEKREETTTKRIWVFMQGAWSLLDREKRGGKATILSLKKREGEGFGYG